MPYETEPLEALVENEWLKSERQIHELYLNGIEAMLRKENMETVFENGEACLCCIDEGTEKGLFRAAGSGILMNDKERAKMVDYLQAMGVKGVRSHQGCGAAELYCKQNGISADHVEEVAKQKAQEMAIQIGVPYLGHIEKLSRPAEFHYARTAYYDATGQFNQAASKDKLPPGFVISRRYMNDHTAFDNLKLSIQIALGQHGFGKKITHEKPMLLIVLADPNDSMFDLDAMRAEMRTFMKQLEETEPDMARRVLVDIAEAPIGKSN